MKNLVLLFCSLCCIVCHAQDLVYKVKKKPSNDPVIDSSWMSDPLFNNTDYSKSYNWYDKDEGYAGANPRTVNIVIGVSDKAQDTLYLSRMPIISGDLIGILKDTTSTLFDAFTLEIQSPDRSTAYKKTISFTGEIDSTAGMLLVQMQKTRKGKAVMTNFEYFADKERILVKLEKTLVILP